MGTTIKELSVDKDFRQSNNFTESRFSDFTLIELKTFEFLASLTKKSDIQYINNKINKVVSIKLVDLANFLDFDVYMYKQTDNIVKNLFVKYAEFKYKDEKGKAYYELKHFIEKVRYKDGIFTFEINHEVLPYFVDIKKEYTNFNYKYMKNLDTVYSLRMYMLLKQYENTAGKIRKFELEELKKDLGILDSYSTYGKLKEKVLQPLVDKINAGSDIKVEFSEIKNGRKVDTIVFKIERVSTKLRIA